MVLDNYIKQDFVKDVFRKSCLIVSDIEEAEGLARNPNLKQLNLVFGTTSLKLIFFNKLKVYHPHIKIINCDSSESRLISEVLSYDEDELIVFDRVNYCRDLSIFNMINQHNRVLIC